MSALLTVHTRAQLLRFARVSALAFVAGLLTTGGKVSWASLWALAAGAAETGLRQLLPVKALPAVTAVLADAEKAVTPPAAPTDTTPAKG